MAGIENKVVFGEGFKLQTSTSDSITRMQRLSTDVSRINYSGSPEGNVSANPSSISHDPTTGNFYLKQSGTGNTGWILINTAATDLHTAKLIVNSTVGAGGNYTTIAAALTAASAGDTIFVMPGSSGVYTENLTLKAGVNITAFNCDGYTPNVTILGKLTASFTGSCSISGIRLKTNSDFFLNLTGGNAQVWLVNCFLNATNNTGMSIDGNVICEKCTGLSTSQAYFTSSGGGVEFFNCDMQAAGGTNTLSGTSTTLFMSNSLFYGNITTSDTALVEIDQSAIEGQLNLNGTSGNDFISNSSIGSGSVYSISIGAGATLSLVNSALITTTPIACQGSGTLNYSGICFINGASSITTTTQNAQLFGPDVVSRNFQTQTAGALRTGKTATNTTLLQAYDTNSASYTTFGTLTANNPATFDLNTSTTINSNAIVRNASNLTDNFLVRGDGGASGVQTSTVAVSDDGSMTNASQPSFLAYLANSQTNATGDGTVAQIAYDTVVFDNASGFTTGAGALYTFPKTGKYLITCNTTALSNAASSFVQFTITATSRGFQIYKSVVASSLLSESQTAIIDATAGDTVSVSCAIFGAGKTAQISGGDTPYYTYIEGVLLPA